MKNNQEMENNKISNNKTEILISWTLLSIFLIFWMNGEYKQTLITLICLWVDIIVYSIKNLRSRIGLLLFSVSFFNFLLGRLINDVFNLSLVDYIVSFDFNDKTKMFMCATMFVALMSVLNVFHYINKDVYIKKSFSKDNEILRIRKISKNIAYFCATFAILRVLESVYKVWTGDYAALYIGTGNLLPSFVYKLSDTFNLVMFIFLATLPSKKECKTLITIYFIIGIAHLFSGVRGGFVVAVFFIIYYYFLRNDIDHEIWISKRTVMLLLCAAPLMIALMYIVMAIRGGNNYDSNFSLSYLIVNHFYQQGGSADIIGLSYTTHFPNEQYYSIGTFIRRFKESIFSLPFDCHEVFENMSTSLAMKGHSLGDFLTYKYQEPRYFSGGSMSTSYIAEAWLDLGFLGIILWSSLWGYMIANIKKWFFSDVWKAAFALFSLANIFMTPRAGCSDFLANILSPLYLVIIILIYYYSKIKNNAN